MRDYGYFWNSRGGDRKYNAEDMADWIAPFFTTGVFGGGLFVKESTNMTVEVEAGYCNFDGKVRHFENSTLFTLEVASLSGNRVDTIVVEKNNSDRSITMKVVTGTEGAGPTAPVRTGDIYQIVLAQISVRASVSTITQADITDTRSDSYLCGTVTPTAFDEFAEEFNSWFEHFKSNISGDAAGQLQNEIDALIEDDFKTRYNMCNATTVYTRNNNGDITGWTTTGPGNITATTTITDNSTAKTYVTAVNDGKFVWTKTSIFTKATSTLTESYTKTAVP